MISSFYEFPTMANHGAESDSEEEDGEDPPSHPIMSIESTIKELSSIPRDSESMDSVTEEDSGSDSEEEEKEVQVMSGELLTSAPARKEVLASFGAEGIPSERHQGPYCSNREDVPDKGNSTCDDVIFRFENATFQASTSV